MSSPNLTLPAGTQVFTDTDFLHNPLELPRQVNGLAIKSTNDLAVKLPEGGGRKIFADLV